MKSFYVYRIEFDGGTFYIGYRGSKKEPEQDLLIHYKTSSKKVKLLIESGVLCTYTILARGMCKEAAYNLEQEFIYNEFNDKMCLNDACYYGRHGFGIISEEAKQRISNSSKDRWSDPDYKQRLSEIHKERWLDEDLKKQQSDRLKNEFWTEDRRAEHSAKLSGRVASTQFLKFTQSPRTEDHKQSISESLKGKPKTDEHKQKLKKPKPLVVCRIEDRKLMAIGNFSNWLKRFTSQP